MSNWQERFFAALAEWLNETGRANASEVSYVDQRSVSAGYGCDTCDYEMAVIEISYIEKDTARSRIYAFEGDMGQLMRELP